MNGLANRGNLLAFGALLLAAASCQLVAGVESRSADPIPGTCTLPSGPGPQVRIANLVPTEDVVDVCIRSAGASSWGHALLLEGGQSGGTAACQQGFPYGHVSVAFTAPGQTIDVKVIPYGQTCSAAGLSEADGVALTGPIDTLLRIGGANNKPEQIIDVPEDNQTNSADVLIRFVHAAPGTGPLVVGLAAGGILPTTVGNPFLAKPVAYAAQPTANKAAFGRLDARGYLDEVPSSFNIGAYVDGDASKKAVFDWVLNNPTAKPFTFSIYAVGSPTDNLHALRALVCNEDPKADNAGSRNGPQEMPGCFFSDLATISVDTFNPALYGPNSPIENLRKDLIVGTGPDSIAARTSDVMCVLEVDDPMQQQTIISNALAAGHFKYSYTGPQMTLSTPFNNPQDQTGKTPPAPTSAPCGSSALQAAATQAIQCLEQSCSSSSTQGDPGGQLIPSDGSGKTGTSCISAQCSGQFGNLLYGSSDQQYCYDCLIDYVASNQKFGDTLTACTTDPRPPLGFVGNDNSFILSHYPITKQATYVLPSSNYRRTVQYAQVQLEDGPVDFYCGFLITPLIASDVPYLGNYGAGGASDDPGPNGGYAHEQEYEAKQLIAWVQQNSGKTPAIIAGEWRSSLGFTPADGGAQPVLDLIPDTMTALSNAFVPATAPNWTPQCNFCPPPANPYNSAGQQFFTQQTFIFNWPGASTATTDESLTFTDNPVALPATLAGDGGAMGPVSPYYGVNVHILRPSASH